MWIFTQNGFISAVRTEVGSQDFIVRARDRKSLELIAEQAQTDIVASPLADYPYRVIVNELVLGAYLMNELAAVDYTNYKNQVALNRGYDFAKVCGSVWSIMHDVEDAEARKRT